MIPSLFTSHNIKGFMSKSFAEGHTLLNQNNLHQHTRILSIHKTKITSLPHSESAECNYIYFSQRWFCKKNIFWETKEHYEPISKKSSLLPTKTSLIWKTFHLLVKTFFRIKKTSQNFNGYKICVNINWSSSII